MNTKTLPYLLAASALALTIGCGKGKISGTVTNSAAKAVEGATVKADPAGKSATTDSAGKYSLEEVSRGDQSVTASKTGYVSQTKAVKIGGTFKGDEATLDFFLGSGYGTANGLAGTTWALSGSGKAGTADIAFASETAGTIKGTDTTGVPYSYPLTITLTHPADTSVEHTDNITMTLTVECGSTITYTGTRTGSTMSGNFTYSGGPNCSSPASSGTWSATLK